MTISLDGLPAARAPGCPFDPPAGLTGLAGLTRMTYPDGHVGWLATGHRAARTVLADPRFSARYELMHHPFPGAGSGTLTPAPPGDMLGVDPPEHTRYRRLLAGRFSVRRMRLLTERAEQLTGQHLDAMDRAGPPVDLVAEFARPIPALMICELLGVPYADHEYFQRHAATVNRHEATEEQRATAYLEIQGYLRELVAAKRAAPTDDLLGDLTTSDLDDEELAGVGTLLLGAGLDTTTNMIALGVFALLRWPEQLAALLADPDRAVEELLRYLSIVPFLVRAALADVALDGHLVKAGETVTVAVPAANRDPIRFADPDTLDVARRATGHLAFGHGVHQCLGQQLARMQMRVAYPALFARYPGLRLAVPPEQVPLRTDMDIYGVHRLPVAWD
ncbi:cytochrome P450 [Pseudonocardia eucalypti]|uniref:Cytochrome P450 n=1 Tax=Pseudonocardia eucalypti TaxID=648755 RepID=A0ABP9QQM2_9PSEU|nr:cytochrome P450 [Pseudonocardia eucalypti]